MIPCLLQPLNSLSSSPGFGEWLSMQPPVPAESPKYDVDFDVGRGIRHEGNGMSYPGLADGAGVNLG